MKFSFQTQDLIILNHIFVIKIILSLQQYPFSKIFRYVPTYQDIRKEGRLEGRKGKKEVRRNGRKEKREQREWKKENHVEFKCFLHKLKKFPSKWILSPYFPNSNKNVNRVHPEYKIPEYPAWEKEIKKTSENHSRLYNELWWFSFRSFWMIRSEQRSWDWLRTWCVK